MGAQNASLTRNYAGHFVPLLEDDCSIILHDRTYYNRRVAELFEVLPTLALRGFQEHLSMNERRSFTFSTGMSGTDVALVEPIMVPSQPASAI